MNGVWVNGLRVQRAILQSKDILHIGNYDFVVEIGSSTIPLTSTGTQSAEDLVAAKPQELPSGKADSRQPHKKAS
jgi:pSer/pThr/pTyr-binding forkhead associated (FHA) protein